MTNHKPLDQSHTDNIVVSAVDPGSKRDRPKIAQRRNGFPEQHQKGGMEGREVLSVWKIISGRWCVILVMFSVTGVFDTGDKNADIKYSFIIEGQESSRPEIAERTTQLEGGQQREQPSVKKIEDHFLRDNYQI